MISSYHNREHKPLVAPHAGTFIFVNVPMYPLSGKKHGPKTGRKSSEGF
jgi:hypothetical protein